MQTDPGAWQVAWSPVAVPAGCATSLDETGLVVSSVRIVDTVVSDELSAGLNQMAGASGWNVLDPGSYKTLLVNGDTMMSDTVGEREECEEAVHLARGDVLVAGLGLGMIIPPILQRCTSLTVIEANPLVYQLVARHYQHPKLSILRADAFSWEPHRRFDFIWLDIWPDKRIENRQEMAQLVRRYRRHLKPGGRIRSWFQDELKATDLFQRSELRRFALFVGRRGPRFVEGYWRAVQRQHLLRLAVAHEEERQG